MAPLDGLASVTFLGALPSGQACSNTFHISSGAGTPPDPADLATLATDLQTYFETDVRALYTTGGQFTSIKTAQVPDPTISGDAYADYLLPINAAGTRTQTDTKLPEQACQCVSLKTNSGQRSYRGHLLMPSALLSGEANGLDFLAGGAYNEAVQTFATLLATGCGPSQSWTGTKLADYSLVIYSKTLQTRGHPSVTGVVSVVAALTIHWLRSRARGTT